MGTVTMLNSVMKTTKDVIIIESDEDENEHKMSSMEGNESNNNSTSNGVVNIVAMYNLVNTKDLGKCDMVNNLISNNEEDMTLPKIVAVTSGIEVIHDEVQIKNTIGDVFVVNENNEVVKCENKNVINNNCNNKIQSEDNNKCNIDENEVDYRSEVIGAKKDINTDLILIEDNTIINLEQDTLNKHTKTIDNDKISEVIDNINEENNSDYESCSDDEDVKKSKQYKFPDKIHIKNRIKQIINRRYKSFRNTKNYPLLKSFIKYFPKKQHRVRNLSIKRNVSRFNTALPVQVILDKKCKIFQNIKMSRENGRLGIQDQLKQLLAKFKENVTKTSLEEENENSLEKLADVEDNSAVAGKDEKDVTSSDQTIEDIPAPCCSKSITDPPSEETPGQAPGSRTRKRLQKNSGQKSCDISKYKSLKYKLIANDLQTTETSDGAREHEKTDGEGPFSPKTPQRTPSPIQGTSSATTFIDLVDDDDCFLTAEKVPLPDLSTVIKKLQNLRQSIGKIPEQEDILARLKSDRNQVQEDDSKEEMDREHVYMLKSKVQKTPTSRYAKQEDGTRIAPVKIALPNGKLVKPKTLAEKRRLMRRERETDLRTKMQTNEQLLERQLLRQKSNNRRTESSDIREQLLQDDAPMTRANWKDLTEHLSSEFPYKTQYMMVDGRYVRICGSRGGTRRFLSPPPPVHLYRRRKTRTKPIPKKIENINIPRFLPGPLSKKHRLLRQPPSGGGEFLSKKLPKIWLEVHPHAGKPLTDTCKAYMKLAFSNNIIDKTRANFAASAVITSAKRSLLMSETFSFGMPYKNGQERVLMRRIDDPKEETKPIVPDIKVDPQVDDKTVVSEVLSDMFSYVETAFTANNVVKEDPDATTTPPSPTLPKEIKVVPQEPARVKAAMELRRLNVTVIKASECSSNMGTSCTKSYCRLGCVCSSLKCLGTSTKRHCGNVDCMFDCRCEFTHRLRQKRSLCQGTSLNETYLDDEDMLELKDRVCSGLARVEAEFKHTVVVNEDKSVTLVDDTEKRKRCVKAPKRFDDFVYSDLTGYVPISPVKKQEDTIMEPIKKILKTPPIVPKEELMVRKMEIRLHNLAMEDVEPWCMVHELYRCFCDCMDAYGEPFGKEKRRSSVDSTEQNDTIKQSSNSIKTLSRTILLESGDDEEKVAQKKNWHVELFSTEEEDTFANKRKKSESKGSFHGFPDSTSVTVRRKSNDRMRRDSSELFKRKRSAEDLVKEKEKEKPDAGMKKPRLQIKSPWDLNLMADKLKDKTSKLDDARGLLREFAMSTKRVIDSDLDEDDDEEEEEVEEIDLPPPELNEEGVLSVEESIRIQRENHKGTMRCARIDDVIKYKIPSMLQRNRKRAAHQKRTTRTAEDTNPDLLKHMNLLVKRSQMASQNRSSKTTTALPPTPRPAPRKSVDSDGQHITIDHNNLGPPPLIPAPGVKIAQPKAPQAPSKTELEIAPKVVNMISSALPPKDQKAMSSVVNTEIVRLLNQKGALDAEFDLSKPWNYRFQCMPWLRMLSKYKSGEIKLWLEKTPEQSSTMALLTTTDIPPVKRCVDMSLLNAAAEQEETVHVPKFASKIHTDCKNLNDPNHKAIYVFMRAHATHWTLEGVIERGQTAPASSKPQKKQEFLTVRPKSDLYEKKIIPVMPDGLANSRPRRSKAPVFTDEKTALLNAELLKARVEIEASVVETKKTKEKKLKPNSTLEKDPLALDDEDSENASSPIEIIPSKRPRRNITRKFEKPVYTKRSYARKSSVRSESSDSIGPADDASNKSDDSESPTKKQPKSYASPKKSLPQNSKSADSSSEVKQQPTKTELKAPILNTKEQLDILTSKRPFTIEESDKKSSSMTINKILPTIPDLKPILPRKETIDIDIPQMRKLKSRLPIGLNPERIEADEAPILPPIIPTNEPATDEASDSEPLPFVRGKRYLFVSMNETFSLLTSSRNGYRVTYLQLASAIQTSIYRNVYVRLKFKHNDLSQDAHGIVFAVPWCKEGVFIGPYGLTEQCMITKQIYHHGKLLTLSEYSRSVEKRDAKPVGYWLCYNGDDEKFVKNYNSLLRRLNGIDNKPAAPVVQSEPAEPKKVLLKMKGTSPNSVLKANLDKVRIQMNGASSEDRSKEAPVMTSPFTKISLSPYTVTKAPTTVNSPLTIMPKLVVIRPTTTNSFNGFTNTITKTTPSTTASKDVATIKLLQSTPSSTSVSTAVEKPTMSVASETSTPRHSFTIKLSENASTIKVSQNPASKASIIPVPSMAIVNPAPSKLSTNPAPSKTSTKPASSNLYAISPVIPRLSREIKEGRSLINTARLTTTSKKSDSTDGDNSSASSTTQNVLDTSGPTTNIHDMSIESTSSTSSTTLTALPRSEKVNEDQENSSSSDSDDEPELIIQEPEIEVIDLSSDEEDEDDDDEINLNLNSPGPRWLYCDVVGIGHLEVQVTREKKLSIRMPMVSTQAEFKDFESARIWINNILKKIIYFLPNSFLPTWRLTTTFSDVKNIPKMNPDIFQGNYVIYKNGLLDLSDQKTIEQQITEPSDYNLAIKYAEHYISRYIKHALGLKFSSRLSQEQLADAANTEVKSIHEVEAKLVEQKKALLRKRTECVKKFKALKAADANWDNRKIAKLSVLKHTKNSTPTIQNRQSTKDNSKPIVIDD